MRLIGREQRQITTLRRHFERGDVFISSYALRPLFCQIDSRERTLKIATEGIPKNHLPVLNSNNLKARPAARPLRRTIGTTQSTGRVGNWATNERM